jgi:hypothetical protein
LSVPDSCISVLYPGLQSRGCRHHILRPLLVVFLLLCYTQQYYSKIPKSQVNIYKITTICISASKYLVKNDEYCTYNSTQNELFNTNRGTIPVYFIIIVWRNMTSPCCLSPVFLHNNIIAKIPKSQVNIYKIRTIFISASKYVVENGEYCIIVYGTSYLAQKAPYLFMLLPLCEEICLFILNNCSLCVWSSVSVPWLFKLACNIVVLLCLSCFSTK